MNGAATGQYGSVEIAADRVIHVLALSIGVIGATALIGVALKRLDLSGLWPILVYAGCLLTMLSCSAAYNLTRRPNHRDRLRRLDHAAIFVMIAGTYTPFTTRMLHGRWGVAMTSLVWVMALAGAFMKLRYPHRLERVDLLLYLALGWMIVFAWEPLLAVIDTPTAALIIAGGILYTIGAGFHAWRGLRFQNAVWHGLVLLGAACHYAAVLRGILLV